MTVSKLTEGLRLIEGGIKETEATGMNDQQAATIRQGIIRILLAARRF
jgi:hypothetical protein